MEEKPKEPKEKKDGVWFPGQVAFNKDLNNNDKMVWWLVNALDDADNHCWAGNYYLAHRLNLSEATVSRSINHLIELGYLYNVSFNGTTRIICVNEDYHKNYKYVIDEWNKRKKVPPKEKEVLAIVEGQKNPEPPQNCLGRLSNVDEAASAELSRPPKQCCGTKVNKNKIIKEVDKFKIVSKETMTDDSSSDDSTFINPDPTVYLDESKVELQSVGSNKTQSVDQTIAPQRTPKGTPKNKPIESNPPKQIKRTLKQKPIAPKPLPKVPAHILELIEYWNSFGIVQHKMPNTNTYKEAVKMLKKLLNASFFDKNGKFGEYSGRAFTEQEIKNSIDNFALAALNYNYMPLNGYKKALQKTGLPSFLHNSYGSEERSLFLEYLDKKPDLAKVSGYLMDDEDPEETLQLKKEYLRITKKEKINDIEDIQKIKFDTVEENKFRLATKKLNAFYKDNKKKFHSWCAGDLYSGTMAAKGKRAQYFLEFIFKNKNTNEKVSKICPGNLCSNYSLDNFGKWCNDQGLFE